MISRQRKLALERAALERLPETTVAKVQLIKRIFGLGAKVISYTGPGPAVCQFCATEPDDLKEVHIMKVPVIETTWRNIGGDVVRTRTVIEVRSVDRVKKWRWKGKPVLRRWPDGRQDWMCSFCGHGL